MVGETNYKGYGTFDGLNAKYVCPFTFNNKFLRMVLQRIRRFPVNAGLDRGETIVIGNSDPEFRGVPARLRKGQLLVDFVRITDERSNDGKYGGICW
jgi:GDP-mannose 6-dehydrogenase